MYMRLNRLDFAESVSIPVQQLACVVARGESFTDEQRETLSHHMDLEQVASLYQPDVSDPIKNLIRSTSGT